jgi:hypothetical protein
MILLNMTLDGLTCIKKFEVHLQVVKRTWFHIITRKDVNSNLNLNQDTM